VNWRIEFLSCYKKRPDLSKAIALSWKILPLEGATDCVFCEGCKESTNHIFFFIVRWRIGYIR
jgi:hypothetical protein